MAQDSHLPQLDSLRTFAVGFVMWSHWAPRYQFGCDWGRVGVTLFFVLSGFLITGILLKGRDRAIPLGRMLKMFYARRALRILPLFYAVLVLATIADAPGVRPAFWWHAFYLSNYYFFHLGEWIGPASHFWSVAVEEQFYMVWAVLILLTPARWTIGAVLLFIASSFIYRCAAVGTPLSYYTTPAVMESLAAGALLAHVERDGRWKSNDLLPIFLLGAGVILVLVRWAPLLQTSLSLISSGLILAAARGARGPLGRVLDWQPLQYLGVISYGLYMVHNFVPFILHDLLKLPPMHLALKLPVCFGVSVMLAAVSWHLFEKPINDLKRHFPYAQPRNAENIAGMTGEPAQAKPL